MAGFSPTLPGRWARLPHLLPGKGLPFVKLGGGKTSAKKKGHKHHKSPAPNRGRALMQGSAGAGPSSSGPPAQPAVVQADVQVSPPYASASYAQLARQLDNSSSSSAASAQIVGVRGISKQGIAGNGVCEVGELPTANSTGALLFYCHKLNFSLSKRFKVGQQEACAWWWMSLAFESLLRVAFACMQGCPRTALWPSTRCRLPPPACPAAAAARLCPLRARANATWATTA